MSKMRARKFGMDFDQIRTFGIEIEFGGVTRESVLNAIRNHGVAVEFLSYGEHKRKTRRLPAGTWVLTTDGSVSVNGYGWELVSPPLSGDTGMNIVKNVCAGLNQAGAKVNKSCGLHVHHHAIDLDLESWKLLFGLYASYELEIDKLVPNSRRSNNGRYIKSLRNDWRLLEKIEEVGSIQDFRYLMSDRYHKLNFQSFVSHGTVEFRQHGGTTEFEKISNWIIFTQIMVTASANKLFTWSGVNEFKSNGKYDWLNFKKKCGMIKYANCSDRVENVVKFQNSRKRQLAKVA